MLVQNKRFLLQKSAITSTAQAIMSQEITTVTNFVNNSVETFKANIFEKINTKKFPFKFSKISKKLHLKSITSKMNFRMFCNL